MSTTYSATIYVGFEFEADALYEKYGKQIEAKTHKEMRYNPKTGKPAGEEEIIDEKESRVYFFQNKAYEDLDTFGSAIAAKVGCFFVTYGDEYEPTYTESDGIEPCEEEYCEGEGNRWLVFFPKGTLEQDGDRESLDHPFTVSGPISYSAVVKLAPKLKELKQKLQKLGLEPAEAQIITAYDVG